MFRISRHLPMLFLAAANLLQAQFPTEVVQATISVDREAVRPGEQVVITVDISINEGWHIYSNTLTGFGPIPTHFEYPEDGLVSASGAVLEPEPAISWDEGFEREVAWHSGSFQMSQAVQISADAAPGAATLTGEFVFLACTDLFCLFPYYQPFSIELAVEEGPVREVYAFIGGQTQEPEQESLATLTGLEGTELQGAIQEGFWQFLLLSLGMGFIALLTPCVFPMIPITVSFFLKQGETGTIKPLKAASLYGGGIVVIYTGLGIFLALTLGAAGANQMAANPVINLLLGGLFVYFAGSLFGLYEIQMPSRLRQFSLAKESRGGTLGIFFMALTFTLTSFTCTIQFVGLLLVAASQGHYLWPVIGMVAYSITFALPFFFLALFPQMLTRLPKSGAWMNSVKVVMGFLELAAAFKFVSNSDLVWSWGFFDHQLVLAAWMILAAMTGFYILGKIRLAHDAVLEFLSVPRLFFGGLFLMFSLLLSPGLIGQQIPGLVEAYLPPRLDSGSGGVLLGNSMAQLHWYSEYPDALAEARRTNLPIFLDVTGYTCTNCRWMEANIFTLPGVAQRLGEFVLLRLYVDGGEGFKEKQRFIIERFGTAALPLYVLIDPDGQEIVRFPGMTRSEEKFTDFLDIGLAL